MTFLGFSKSFIRSNIAHTGCVCSSGKTIENLYIQVQLSKLAFKEVSVLSPSSALFCSVVISPPCECFHWPVGEWMALLAPDMQIKGLDINSNCTEVQVQLKTYDIRDKILIKMPPKRLNCSNLQ